MYFWCWRIFICGDWCILLIRDWCILVFGDWLISFGGWFNRFFWFRSRFWIRLWIRNRSIRP